MRFGAPIGGPASKAFLTPGLGGRSAELEREKVSSDMTSLHDDTDHPASVMPSTARVGA
jgi:hypothetical protein